MNGMFDPRWPRPTVFHFAMPASCGCHDRVMVATLELRRFVLALAARTKQLEDSTFAPNENGVDTLMFI